MPVGAGPGGDVELLAVATKVREAAEGQDSQEIDAADVGLGFSDGRDARITKKVTAIATTNPIASHQPFRILELVTFGFLSFG